MVYDITKMESFRNVELWFQEIDKNAGVYTRKILVGNKVDLEEERAVPYRDAKEFADNFGVTLIEASAKEAKNVDECFMRMAAEIMETWVFFHIVVLQFEKMLSLIVFLP